MVYGFMYWAHNRSEVPPIVADEEGRILDNVAPASHQGPTTVNASLENVPLDLIQTSTTVAVLPDQTAPSEPVETSVMTKSWLSQRLNNIRQRRIGAAKVTVWNRVSSFLFPWLKR